MNDMSMTIIPKVDQITADDLLPGPRTIRITAVKISPGEQPVTVSFEDDGGRPWKPCKSMCRVLVALWGADANAYVGRSLTLYRDAGVKWGGLEVGGIRISAMSDIPRSHTMALTQTKGNKKPFTVQPLKVETKAATAPAATERRQTVSEWLAALEADLAAAASTEAVEARVARDDVRTMLAKGSENAKAQTNKLVADALARFAEAVSVDDDSFPGDLSSPREVA